MEEEVVVVDDDREIGEMSSGEIALSWDNLCYEVPEVAGDLIKRRTGKTRRLLNEVSGFARVGECVAVMGPSGCGKSTLLDVLTGRVHQGKHLNGEILIYGQAPKSAIMKREVAYVRQEDALYGVLTVRENLYYSAMLRLPPSMPKQEKLARVDEVIQELGLTKCANTKIGNVFFRGISGGERRRCSIGMELITRPRVLLLDEPTSGLDAKSSRMIVETLCQLAKNGKTVISTIHQPSSQVFQMFDKVILLSQGEQVFYGPSLEAVNFFEQCGHTLPPMMNPADHYLETINFDFEDGGDGSQKPEKVQEIINNFKGSNYKKELENELQSQEKRVDDGDGRKYETSFGVQLFYLCDRTFWVCLRDPGIFWARVIMYSLMALMMGTLYLRMGYNQSTIQDRISVLFFSVAFLCFMSVAAIPAFLIERDIFIHERRNGYYSVGPFALAHTLVSIPFVFLIAVSFAGISYYMMEMNEEPEAFFYFLLGLTVALINAEGIVASISAIVPSFIVGIAVGAGLFGMYMLLCGFFVRASNIPDYWIWFHYLVFHKYCFEGFMVNEFKSGKDFSCYETENPTDFTDVNNTEVECVQPCLCLIPDLNQDCQVDGYEILFEYEYEDVNKWWWLLVLVAMAIFYNFCFYIFLRVFNTGER